MEPNLELDNPRVQCKYKAAAEIANNVMVALIAYIKPGRRVLDICIHGDSLIEEMCQSSKESEKGVAFPTCVSINNCSAHMCPLEEDEAVIVRTGDLVKVDLGVQIGGYPSVCAHTWIISQKESISDKRADLIMAAFYASECALRLLAPGNTNTYVTSIIKKCCDVFHVKPVESVLSHRMMYNTFDGEEVIMNMEEPEQRAKEFCFQPYQAYGLDIVVSTGEGKTSEGGNRTTVFKRNWENNYQLKLQASRQILSEVSSKFPYFPFTLRYVSTC
eukprot:TRINITY_DN5908_c0_g1_i3.p1 TRINITY_DN5908_c0_g1~~TRINITY_DN5908_c0_g1_i3.p1  ORF type:complete len:286 (-),score=33.40 TRINITY_DN5908_c0_g1_i3:564-1385(-)